MGYKWPEFGLSRCKIGPSIYHLVPYHPNLGEQLLSRFPLDFNAQNKPKQKSQRAKMLQIPREIEQKFSDTEKFQPILSFERYSNRSLLSALDDASGTTLRAIISP